jgi:hypothetical protein
VKGPHWIIVERAASAQSPASAIAGALAIALLELRQAITDGADVAIVERLAALDPRKPYEAPTVKRQQPPADRAEADALIERFGHEYQHRSTAHDPSETRFCERCGCDRAPVLHPNEIGDSLCVFRLLDALEEGERSFALRQRADQRAIDRWRSGVPSRELVSPDHADLVVWLLERVDQLERDERECVKHHIDPREATR